MFTTLWKTCSIACYSLSVVVGCLFISGKCIAQEPPFLVPDGFLVQRVADDALSHDCFCMTLDSLGRPVISGPGYLRTLVDDDNDGIYDRAVSWTKEIKQGAQGLWSEGRTLYWVADGGLWKSEDSNGDLVADRGATRVLELPTGGEHDAHAIRRGPDGYWYLVAGNFASTVGKLANDASAPITRARAGTLWRISPDFSRRGVWAHGLRNCYDFDFLPDGQIVTYDSDDEREATLPWYRPTRTMVLGPGSDAGWCGPAWKDDDYRVTMPLVLARLGRGSPTGVAVYDHHRFPEKYHEAVFVLDWTFGRVIAIHPSENLDESQRIAGKVPSEIFMQPSGNAGFAPTDICVAPDGSLLISVGGRGTTGAIYRVTSTQQKTNSEAAIGSWFDAAVASNALTQNAADQLQRVLSADCPWDSWSESKWRPMITPALLEQLNRVLSGQLPISAPDHRIAKAKLRAAQILTRVNAKVTADAIARATTSDSPATRAAAWWLAQRSPLPAPEEQKLQRAIRLSTSPTSPAGTSSPAATTSSERTRWESHLGPSDERLQWETVGLKRLPCSDTNSFPVEDSLAGNALRRSWLWALSRTPIPPSPKNNNANKLDAQIGKLLFGPAKNNVDTGIFETLSSILTNYRNSTSSRDPLELLTVMQAALGDRRWTLPLQSDVPADVLDGYRGIHTAKMQDSTRNSWARWALHFAETAESNGQVILHAEAMRTMAILEPSEKECVAYLLKQIQPESHPSSDLHALCCIAQCTAPRTPEESAMTASGIANIIGKVKSRGLYTDNQWPTRLKQLVQSLSSRDAKFGEAYAALPPPSSSEDLVLVSSFSNDIQASIKQKIREQLRNTPVQQWSVPIVKYALTGSIDDGFRTLLQQATSEESLRGTCLDILSSEPKESDYDIYLSAVESSDRTLWPTAWKGIASMDLLDPQRELGAMAKLVSASLNTNVALPRPAVLKRARSLAAQTQKPSPPSSEKWADWDQYYRSNLTEQQCNELIPPANRVDTNTALQSIQNLVGNAANGKSLYQTKCGLCHGGQSSLGPSLVGVAKRFSREDLAKAIYEPSRDVSDRYRAVRVLTVDDEILTGMVIYNAADGVTLQAADGSILRINQDTITEKAYSTESLMPIGLLDDKSPQEVADLFAYLSTLQ